MEHVQLVTIRQWEHHMIRWMEAYQAGLTAKDAQFRVKQFSSKKSRQETGDAIQEKSRPKVWQPVYLIR
jgi:hypothetical protein